MATTSGTTQTTDGTTIAFDDHAATADAGHGASPVILVHGITESAVTWDPLIPLLTSQRRVVALDLRGHGRSGTADRYDLEAMAGDVVAVASHLELERPHLVGHSLGGAVVSAVGAVLAVSTVVNVDQSLQLDAFKEQLMAFEAQLRDPEAFPAVVRALFEMLAGEKISPVEMERINAARQPSQDVVLGVWQMILTSAAEEIAAVVDTSLAGYSGMDVAYLALFGIDPGDGYGDWLADRIDGAVTEVWPDHGHYPHLVEPERFVARLAEFWG